MADRDTPLRPRVYPGAALIYCIPSTDIPPVPGQGGLRTYYPMQPHCTLACPIVPAHPAYMQPHCTLACPIVPTHPAYFPPQRHALLLSSPRPTYSPPQSHALLLSSPRDRGSTRGSTVGHLVSWLCWALLAAQGWTRIVPLEACRRPRVQVRVR